MPHRQAGHPLSERHIAILRHLGTTIRTYRQRKGLTLVDLRGLTHLSLNYLSQIERGERNVSLISLIRIADALMIPYTDLLQPLLQADTLLQGKLPVDHSS